jgi:hypothetical protein
MAVGPATPEYMKWSDGPITFDRSDHPDFVPKPGCYPLIINPIVHGVKLNRVFVDGGSSLNILFLKAFDQMGLPRSVLWPCKAPFHGVIPGTSANPISQITLPVTFRTFEHWKAVDLATRTESIFSTLLILLFLWQFFILFTILYCMY